MAKTFKVTSLLVFLLCILNKIHAQSLPAITPVEDLPTITLVEEGGYYDDVLLVPVKQQDCGTICSQDVNCEEYYYDIDDETCQLIMSDDTINILYDTDAFLDDDGNLNSEYSSNAQSKKEPTSEQCIDIEDQIYDESSKEYGSQTTQSCSTKEIPADEYIEYPDCIVTEGMYFKNEYVLDTVSHKKALNCCNDCRYKTNCYSWYYYQGTCKMFYQVPTEKRQGEGYKGGSFL